MKTHVEYIVVYTTESGKVIVENKSSMFDYKLSLEGALDWLQIERPSGEHVGITKLQYIDAKEAFKNALVKLLKEHEVTVESRYGKVHFIHKDWALTINDDE